MEYVISNSNFVEEAYSTGLASVHQELHELSRVLDHLPPPIPPNFGGLGGQGGTGGGAAFMKLGRALWNKVLGHIEAVAILYSTGRAPTTWRIFIATNYTNHRFHRWHRFSV